MRLGWGCCGGLRPNDGWRRTGPKGRRRRLVPSYRCSVVFNAVVSDEIHQVIEFFRTPGEAEAMLERVLNDEPGWRETLYIDCVEFVTGGRN